MARGSSRSERRSPEQFDIIPAQVRVLRHVRKKYACPHCQVGVKTAPLPPQPLQKSMASPGLLAHIAVAKYQDALPLHRQEHILKRIGIELPRATLAAWMIKLGIWIQPLINLLQDVLLGYDILHMDETTLQVLKESRKAPHSPSYLWVRRGGLPHQPVILFNYDPSRSQAVPLGSSTATEAICKWMAITVTTPSACNPTSCSSAAWPMRAASSTRRSRPRGHIRTTPGRPARPWKGFAIQSALGSSANARTSPRRSVTPCGQQKAKPLDTLRAWLDTALPTVPSQTMIGKALTYLHNQWPKLMRYLSNGRLSIDNNPVENAIRPFVIGRRNWLFSDTARGAKSSANLYSLIETAKAKRARALRLSPPPLTELPKAQTLEQIEALLPFHVKTQPLRPPSPE